MTDPVVAPTRTDPIARIASERFGGPAGRHGSPHPFWTPVRVVIALATIVACLGLVQKVPCMQTHWDNNSVRYTKMCYSDIPYLYTGRGMDERAWPYLDHGGRFPTMEYPVGISYVAWGVAEVLRPFAAGPSQQERLSLPNSAAWGMQGMAEEINQYFVFTAVVLLACLIGAAWLLARAQPRRPWDAMAFALSPCLLVTALVNWDLLAVVLVAGVLWAWGRLDGDRRMLVVGALIGAGTATKLYPAVLLGAVIAIGVRRRDWRGTTLCVVSAAVTWFLVNVPALATGYHQWQTFWRFNQKRGADLGSLWLLAQDHGATVPPHLINIVSEVAVVLAFIAVVVLTVRAPEEPRLSQLAFLLVAAFLLVNKVYSPQYVLWLLPLAVLARPRWRDLLIWQATELFYFGSVWLYLDGFTTSATAGAPDHFYQFAILVRVIGELYLVAMVVRDVLGPHNDPARTDEAGNHVPALASV